MPSFDIYALFKDALAFFKRHNPKFAVLKYVRPADDDPTVLAITNMTDFPITIHDFGFDHSGVPVSVCAPYVLRPRSRIKFPYTIEPRATLDLRIALGAVDLWQTDDCYFVDVRGRRHRVKAKYNPPAAR